MGPQGTCENLFARIRKKLRKLHVFNSYLLYCAQCGKRVATIHQAILREETDGVALCQSCFELILKNAAQTPEYGEIAYDSLDDLDEHFAELLFPAGCITQGPSDLQNKPIRPRAPP